MLHESKDTLLTEVEIKGFAVELTDLCCRYIIIYVSNAVSSVAVACD